MQGCCEILRGGILAISLAGSLRHLLWDDCGTSCGILEGTLFPILSRRVPKVSFSGRQNVVSLVSYIGFEQSSKVGVLSGILSRAQLFPTLSQSWPGGPQGSRKDPAFLQQFVFFAKIITGALWRACASLAALLRVLLRAYSFLLLAFGALKVSRASTHPMVHYTVRVVTVHANGKKEVLQGPWSYPPMVLAAGNTRLITPPGDHIIPKFVLLPLCSGVSQNLQYCSVAWAIQTPKDIVTRC